MIGRSKAKTFDKLVEDPTFHFMIGRLVGAAEISGFLLVNQENPDVKQIGTNLSNAVSWFFETEVMKRDT